MDTKELADRILLKELVDKVSILADKKNIHNQVQLFSEDAISETFIAGTLFLKLKGRTEMEKAFDDFLRDFEIVSHFNGQQCLTISGDIANGTSYSLITLIGIEGGKKIRTTISAVYEDDFIRENSKWLIAKRVGNFQWQEKHEVNQ